MRTKGLKDKDSSRPLQEITLGQFLTKRLRLSFNAFLWAEQMHSCFIDEEAEA